MTRIALAQMRLEPSWEVNLERGLEFLAEAVQVGASLVMSPELQFSPFFPRERGADSEPYLFPFDHPSVGRFQEACRKHRISAIINGYYQLSVSNTASDVRTFDASPVIDARGALLGISKMVHIVDMEAFHEQEYYAPAPDGFHSYDLTPPGDEGLGFRVGGASALTGTTPKASALSLFREPASSPFRRPT